MPPVGQILFPLAEKVFKKATASPLATKVVQIFFQCYPQSPRRNLVGYEWLVRFVLMLI
jgi:hypothetical protein